MKKKLYLLLGIVLFWLAQVNVAAACGVHWYEPEVPESLR